MIINDQNIVVGAGQAFIGGHVTAVSAATGSTETKTVLEPITDAVKFSLGDVITVGSDPKKVQVEAIDEETGALTHEAVSTPASAAVPVVQVWRNLGATDGGVELTGGMTPQEHFVDQTVFPVAMTVNQAQVGLNVPMAEQTLQNLALALGQESSKVKLTSGVETLAVGATDKIRQDRYLLIGPGPKGRKRTVLIHKGVNRGTLSYRQDKANKAIANLEIGAMFDSSKPKGEELMLIQDHASEYQF